MIITLGDLELDFFTSSLCFLFLSLPLSGVLIVSVLLDTFLKYGQYLCTLVEELSIKIK